MDDEKYYGLKSEAEGTEDEISGINRQIDELHLRLKIIRNMEGITGCDDEEYEDIFSGKVQTKAEIKEKIKKLEARRAMLSNELCSLNSSLDFLDIEKDTEYMDNNYGNYKPDDDEFLYIPPIIFPF